VLEILEAIGLRRTTGRLVEPGPGESELRKILEAATRAPDHGRCRPWRFIIVPESGADGFGAVLESAYLQRCRRTGTPVDPSRRIRERERVRRTPTFLVVACCPRLDIPIPAHEQVAAVAAATENLLLAATAFGYGSKWATGPAATDPMVKRALELGADDSIVGFVHLGSVAEDSAKPRAREEDISTVVQYWRRAS
jgi:nitroreductase